MSRRSVARLATVLIVALSALLGGCAAVMTRNGIADPRLAQVAEVADLPGVRFWGDEIPAGDLRAEVARRLPGLPRLAQGAQRIDGRPVVEILALSGGGGDGAFGAGVLAGWTVRGTRPRFEVVTGVSAGAIIAPFAFLGPRYDDKLKEVWTQYRTSQVITAQIVPGLLGGTAIADSAPMLELMEKYVDKRMLREIAAEYRQGRLLLVGTTNLDAQRPVVWNLGAIAASRHPDAPDLFRKVILASAAIPGALPPVSIPVRAGGMAYDEMHVDGGTTREVFVSPVQVPFTRFDVFYDAPPIRRLYIINNIRLTPELQVVTPQTIPIAARAISTLIKSQSGGDIYRIFRMARDGGADFNLLSIPPTFDGKANEFFDPAYQTRLFEEGFRTGRAGGPWMKMPPDTRMVTVRR